MSGGHTEVMIRMIPPATNAPPDMTPRELLRGDGIAAIAHTLIPTATRIVPIILRGRAVFAASQPLGGAPSSGGDDGNAQKANNISPATIAKPNQITTLAMFMRTSSRC
jgi:hypothetical protein